jgi:cyanophycin synthetase
VCADDDTPQVLAEQGFAVDSVVPAGVWVVLSRIAHSWAGAGVSDVTDQVHPRVAAQAVRAARLIGLDVAGLDVVALDIGRPLEDQGGVILEVNAEPTIAFHFPPLCDRYRPVCEAIVESLFPDGQTGRIPVTAVSGRGDRTGTGRWLAELLRDSRGGVGRASREGLFLHDQLLKSGDQANLAGTLALLLCPEIDSAILELSLAGIRHERLGVDRVDATILTGLGSGGESSLDAESEQAARVLVAATAPEGVVVIEVDDGMAGATAAAIAESFAGTVVVVSGSGPLGASRGRRHTAVRLRGDQIVAETPDRREQILARISTVPDASLPSGLLAAVAAAWAMGVPADGLERCLELALRDRAG